MNKHVLIINKTNNYEKTIGMVPALARCSM